MVRQAKQGRSRACLLCRRRRIKCDLTQPQCQRCLESGRDCPGPVTGVIFLQSKPKSGIGLGSRQPEPEGSRLPARSLAYTTTAHVSLIFQAPTPAAIFEESLLGKILDFFSRGARRSTWILKLPSLRDRPNAPALRSCLQAVSLAYAAHQTQDQAVKVAAYRHYGNALHHQRTALAKLPSNDYDTAINALLTTVLLSYYELISGTTLGAWSSHTRAAEKIMTVLGPRALQHELISQLFYSIRSHAVQRAAIQSQCTVFAEDEWLEIGMCHSIPQSRARDSYDRMVELILRLCKKRNSRTISNDNISTCNLLAQLKIYYSQFLSTEHLTPTDLPLLQYRTTNIVTADEALPGFDTNDITHGIPTTLHPNLRKPFPAMALAHFHVALILLHGDHTASLCPHYTSGPYSAPCRPLADLDTTQNARTIIATGVYLSDVSLSSNATAVLRMVLPFSVVWRYSQDQDLTWQARTMFERWCTREGLGGLVGVAFA